MSNTNEYILLIDEIAELYFNEIRRQEIVKRKYENDFCVFCEELNLLYKKTVDSLFQKYVAPFVKQYSFLNTRSFLQIVQKERKENCHSLFLKYVLNSQCKIGSFVLKDFCNAVGCQAEWTETIKQNSYIIQDEFSTKRQRKASLSLRRFDLLIEDDTNKWLVVIENKIESKIRENKGNQLDAYREFCERTHPNYSKLYVLLSYNLDNLKNVEKRSWKPMNYYVLFSLLLKYAAESDLVKDYLSTLYSMLFSDVQIPCVNERMSLFRCGLFINRVILKLN